MERQAPFKPVKCNFGQPFSHLSDRLVHTPAARLSVSVSVELPYSHVGTVVTGFKRCGYSDANTMLGLGRLPAEYEQSWSL